MTNNNLTLKDISKSIKLCKENTCLKKRYDYDWGWIETDGLGMIEKIGLSKKMLATIKECFKIPKGNIKLRKGKIIKFMGIKIVETNHIENLE